MKTLHVREALKKLGAMLFVALFACAISAPAAHADYVEIGPINEPCPIYTEGFLDELACEAAVAGVNMGQLPWLLAYNGAGWVADWWNGTLPLPETTDVPLKSWEELLEEQYGPATE